MKTRLFLFLMLLVSISCKNSNTLTNKEKDKIKVEIKEVVNKMFKGCEEANFEMAIEAIHESPDFIFLIDRKSVV